MTYQGWIITFVDGMPVLRLRVGDDPKMLYIKYEHALLGVTLASRAEQASASIRPEYQDARDRQLLWKTMINIMDERGITV